MRKKILSNFYKIYHVVFVEENVMICRIFNYFYKYIVVLSLFILYVSLDLCINKQALLFI
jgi:hypothetical protein